MVKNLNVDGGVNRRLDVLVGMVVAIGTMFVVLSPIRLAVLVLISIVAVPLWAGRSHSPATKMFRIAILIWVTSIFLIGLAHGSARYSTWYMAAYPLAIFSIAMFIQSVSKDSTERYISLAFWISLGLGAGYLVQPIGITGVDPLKAGPGIALSIAIFAYLSWRQPRPTTIFLISVGFGAFLLAQDFRNAAAAAIVTGLMAAFFGRFPRTPTIPRAILVLTAAVAASLVMVSTLTALAGSGYLGADLAALTEKQSQADGGIIVGGRPETLASVVAIESAPILGRGGSPRLNYAERLDAIDRMTKAGIRPSPVEINRIVGSQVNSHSVFFSAWVAYGLVGALAWLGVLGIIWTAALRSLMLVGRLYPLLLFGAIQLSWDIFFSPWNARSEVIFGLFCALAIFELRSYRGQRSKFSSTSFRNRVKLSGKQS